MNTHIQQAGFTLVEVLIATILVGLSVSALLTANGTFSMINGVGADMTTAEFLMEQFRERTTTLSVLDPQTTTATFGLEEPNMVNADDIDDYDGQAFSPPIDAAGNALTEFRDFTQRITVENVSKNDLALVVGDHSSDFVRISVVVAQNNQDITAASWIRARF